MSERRLTGTCAHGEKFRGVVYARNGCIACEAEWQATEAARLRALNESLVNRLAAVVEVLCRKSNGQGGDHTLENVWIVSHEANRAKGGLSAEDFIRLCADIAALHASHGESLIVHGSSD